MNHDPTNPPVPDPIDEQLDALLAEEAARAQQTPSELEAKVLALTEPAFLSLLDEALAPESVPAPDQLAEKIIAATTPEHATHAVREQPAVIERIGPSPWRYAAAAAVVLAAGAGLWWAGQPGTNDGGDGGTEMAKTLNNITDELVFPDYTTDEPMFADVTEQIDAAFNNVSQRIDGYAIDRDTIWSDMDDYEAFLSDFEAAGEGTPAT